MGFGGAKSGTYETTPNHTSHYIDKAPSTHYLNQISGQRAQAEAVGSHKSVDIVEGNKCRNQNVDREENTCKGGLGGAVLGINFVVLNV